MINNIELYVKEPEESTYTRLDLFDDEKISLTQTIQDIKDPEKVFTNFSKTFTLPASKTNNKFFKRYEIFIQDAAYSYDARKKSDAKIELNSYPFQTGKLRLEGVEKKDGKLDSYKVTFFGNLQNLKDILGDLKLADLDFLSNFDQAYSASNISNHLTSTSGAGNVTAGGETFTTPMLVSLINNRIRLFYSSENTVELWSRTNDALNDAGGNLRRRVSPGDDIPSGLPDQGVLRVSGIHYRHLTYSLRLYAIVRAIEESNITKDSNGNKQIIFSDDFFNTTNGPFYKLYMLLQREEGEIKQNLEAPTVLAGYNNSSQTLSHVVKFSNSFRIYNLPSNQTIQFQATVTFGSGASGSSPTKAFQVELQANSATVFQFNFAAGETQQVSGTSSANLPNGDYSVIFRSAEDQLIDSVEIVLTDTYGGGNTLTFSTSNLTSNFTITPAAFSVQENIPEMKIIDFITGLFKVFNLTAYKEDGKIYVKTLDSFYEDGALKNWTEYIDNKQQGVNPSLPYREIKFKYEGTDNLLAKQHEEQFGLEWGALEYEGDTKLDAVNDRYVIEAPFEHMKFERLYDGTTQKNIQVGHLIKRDGGPYLGKPVIYYPIHSTTLGVTEDTAIITNLRYYDDDGSTDSTSINNISAYWMPFNSPTVDNTNTDYPKTLHFGLELQEWTGGSDYTESLFEQYYKQYIVNAFRFNERLSTFKAFLPISILQNLSLADEIQINDLTYRINKITTNLQTGESDLELLNGKEVIPLTGGGSVSVTVSDIDYNTVALACAHSGNNQTLYYSGSLGNNTRLYDTSGLLDYYEGDGDFYSFNNNYVGKISSLGTITEYQVCPSLSPEVTTNSQTSVTYNSFTANGSLDVANGTVTAKGFYIGVNSDYNNNTQYPVSGTSLGSYSYNFTNAVANTTYYITAYATNGNGTGVGTTINFTTLAAPNTPTVVNLSELSVSSNSFTARLEITADGGSTINGAGFYMGTDSSSATNNTHYDISPAPNNIGVKSYDFSGLNASTTYYYWGTATNTYSSTKGVASSYETVTTTAPVYTYNNTYYSNNDAYYACISSSPQDYYSYDSTFGAGTTLYTTNTGGILSNLAPNGYYARDNYSYQVSGGNGTLGTQTACQTQTVYRVRITSDYPSTNYYDIETANSSTLSTTNVLYMTAYIGSGRVCYSDEALTTTYTGLGTWKTDRGSTQYNYQRYPENKMFLARQQQFINGAWTDITSTATDSGYDDRICQLSSSGVLELVYYNYNTGALVPTGSASITSIEIGNNNFANSTLACADTSTSKTRVYFTGTTLSNGTRLWEDSVSAGQGSGTEFEGDGDYRKIYMPDGTTKAALVSGSGYISNLTSC